MRIAGNNGHNKHVPCALTHFLNNIESHTYPTYLFFLKNNIVSLFKRHLSHIFRADHLDKMPVWENNHILM